jgi:hypothetical protein
MAEFNTIPNLNWLPIEVPQNVKNFIKALESSRELLDNVDVFQYEVDEPRAIYTDFTIEVEDCGEYLIEMALDIDSENPGYTHIQFTVPEVVEGISLECDISSNLENYCDSLDEAKSFLNKLFKTMKQEVIALQEEFAKN